MTIDEMSRRKPSFDEANSVGVVLADGQVWFVPRTRVVLWPKFQGGEVKSTYPVRSCGPRYDALIQAISEAKTTGELLSGAATLGAWLLLEQYDLSEQDLDALFCGDPGRPATWDWAKDIVAAACGTPRNI